jgi:putative tricarboxylic transport membrane protein
MGFKDMGMRIVKKDVELWPSLFLMIFSGMVAIGAYNFGLGNFHSPGPGFMFFGTSSLLGLMSLRLFLKSLLASGRIEGEYTWEVKNRGRVVSFLVVLVIYIFLLNPVGYLLATFFFLILLFRLLSEGEEKKKWISIVGGAAFISFVSYLVFSRWFMLQFPKGLIRFF